MRSYVPKINEITREWRVLDASEHVLGRLATEVARLLRANTGPTSRRTSTPVTLWS